METTSEIQKIPASLADFSSPFVLKGKKLQVKINWHPIEKPVQKQFKSEKELLELVTQNGKILFGENTIILEGEKIIPAFLEESVIPAFLIDLKDMEKPKFYIVEVVHSKQSLGELLMRLTRILSLLKNRDNWFKLSNAVAEVKSLKKEFKGNDSNIVELIHSIMTRKPAILLVMDSERQELSGFMETYSEWEAVKPIVFRKFSSKGETIITMHPDFDTVRSSGKKKVEKSQYTEGDHLEDVSDSVKEVYEKIKAELLKKDSTLQFNVQRYYISMRKNRNLAFFHIGKKKISLVVMNPDNDTRKQIKQHEVKTLTEKVQKFWNGASCTIVLENIKHLNEVIFLLRASLITP